jgi:hypothetical protein
VVGASENGNKTLGSIRGGYSLDQLSKFQFCRNQNCSLKSVYVRTMLGSRECTALLLSSLKIQYRRVGLLFYYISLK